MTRQRENDIMSDTLPEGFKSVSEKPESGKTVKTATLWTNGLWFFGNAIFKNGQYYNSVGKEIILDTPSGWKY